MQSDLQHEKYETLIRVINEGHDETVKDSKSTPMGNVKGGEYQKESRYANKRFECNIFFQFYQEHAAVPYDDESWENYRRTMYWFNPKVSLASRLAFNFAGQTLDFLKHREDYQMVIAKLLIEKNCGGLSTCAVFT